jgi:hypothetical protein
MSMFTNCIDAETEFDKCWNDPSYTQVRLDDVDINQVLKNYRLSKPLHFTKKMLWDMETKKAWNPAKYIPYVVREGSAESWGKRPCPVTGGEIFVRASAQKKWLNPTLYETVYEEVYVNSGEMVITFIGTTVLPGRRGSLVPGQPLFHVQHSAEGSEERPLNCWRIVHLTKSKDAQLLELFQTFNDPVRLPGFIEVYIENDLGLKINKEP